ncbi:Oxygen regulatory protein NreC [Polystyrenella longa]|uniref:Oxygen regulatory protein NreC n=1 Tax=Polystyrenella longa TaxID=2528007 RepID=A0A518CGR0_9PLAN|nr:response regulator transcription factor [Polystyrenella longa]QDU78409.1 Oxygen regulatory protein NreC [Polystyrenella longa]
MSSDLSDRIQPIRLVLLDDHRIFLDSLSFRINRESTLQVVGVAESAQEALPLLLEHRPDILVLDLALTQGGTFELCEEMKRQELPTRICFLTNQLVNVFIEQALRLEAHGYLLKVDPLCKLLEAIPKIHQGEQVFSEEIQQRLRYNRQTKKYTIDSPHSLKKLTSRQFEVLRQLARGKSVKEVAKDMHLSTKSVDSHKYRIMHKLGIHDRVELARFAIREGLLLP